MCVSTKLIELSKIIIIIIVIIIIIILVRIILNYDLNSYFIFKFLTFLLLSLLFSTKFSFARQFKSHIELLSTFLDESRLIESNVKENRQNPT